MIDLGAGFWIFGGSDYTLDGLAEDNVRQLIAGEKIADQCSTIGCDDKDLLC